MVNLSRAHKLVKSCYLPFQKADHLKRLKSSWTGDFPRHMLCSWPYGAEMFLETVVHSSSASQNISFFYGPRSFVILLRPSCNFSLSLSLTLSPLSYIKAVHNLPLYFKQIHFNNVLRSKRCLPSGLFHHISLLRPTRYTFRRLNYLFFFLIWSLEKYLVRSKSYKAFHYGNFSSLLLLLSLYAQMSSCELNPRICHCRFLPEYRGPNFITMYNKRHFFYIYL